MYKEIIENLKQQLSQEKLNKMTKSNVHLGIFTEPYLTYMLEGKKTIESRFSKNKILPYNEISKNDIVIVKKSSGNVVAYFTIKEVLFFNLKETPINEIKNNYGKELCVEENFWLSKKDSNYATLIIIDNIVKLNPFHINKKGMQTWIKLKKEY